MIDSHGLKMGVILGLWVQTPEMNFCC